MTITFEASGSRKYLRALTALIWLSVPLMAGLYAIWWQELPARLATHFDFANYPNGWMSREGSLVFWLVIGTSLAGMASLILFRVKKPDPLAWALLILFYVIIGTLLWAEEAIIGYNVHRQPVNVAPVLVTGMAATILVVIIAFGTGRGIELSPSKVLAVETHGSAMLGLLLGMPAIAMIAAGTLIPVTGARVAIDSGAVLMLAAGAAAWHGFRYVFSPQGLDIRTLGFRLRSIPAAEIQSYAVDRWNALGGYGIRGIGDKRAYVWGNRGVRIKTFEGEIFLGHDQPEKIVRDLDLITRNHQAREAGLSS